MGAGKVDLEIDAGVLTPTQSNLVYLAYGIAILALPFVILVSLIKGNGSCWALRRPRR